MQEARLSVSTLLTGLVRQKNSVLPTTIFIILFSFSLSTNSYAERIDVTGGIGTASDLPITDSGSIITGTNVETALQENRTAIDLNTTTVVVVKTFISAGINAAIDALGSEGGEVYLPEGDYDVTGVITIDQANTTLRGAGKGTRLLATNRFVYTTVTGTPAAGETLIGDTNSYTATVVQVDTTNKIVWYHSLSNVANYVDGEVISWSGGADTTINGTPTKQSFDVIDTNDKDYVTISDLCIYGGSGGGCNTYIIGDSTSTCDYLVVKNVYIYESDSSPIFIAGDYAYFENVHFEQCEGSGILLVNALFATIQNCRLVNSHYRLAYIYSTSPNCNIIANVITVPSHEGIYVASDNSSVKDNIIKTSAMNGINIAGNYCLISGNEIDNTVNGYSDILITGDYNIISDNNLRGNGSSDKGIFLDEADYCTVSGNFSTGHDVAGIQEDADCQNNLIVNNNLQDTTRSIINGTLHEGLDLPVSLVDGTGIYTLRPKAGWGYIYSSDNVSYAYFTFTSAGVPTLVSHNNCTTIADNDTTLNIYDGGTAVVIENELGATYKFRMDIKYID